MKLKDYAEKINELAKSNPDLDVVYAIDDEGNGFREVKLDPTVGYFDKDDDIFYDDTEDIADLEKEINCVCIN